MKRFLLILSTCLGLNVALAQYTVSGVVLDKETGETLPGANVLYGSNKGVAADLDGKFSFSLPNGTYTLQVSFVGYNRLSQQITVNGKARSLKLAMTTQSLAKVVLIADIAQERSTPTAFSNVKPKKIAQELGGRDLPLILNHTPGVYATQSGGGDGDARINIRGFKQENMAVLIDGIPVNDMENGAVYWSNWFGLDVITTNMQVQRGLSASKLSIPSVGGTINILTNTMSADPFFKINQQVNQFGKSTTSLGYYSGLSKKGWSFKSAFSYINGSNYADNTGTEGFFAYGKVSKKIDKHVLSISSFVAPRNRSQRSSQQRIKTYDLDYAEKHGVDISINDDGVPVNLGRNYNRNWGYLKRDRYNSNVETERLSERRNFYSKPQFNLNHTYVANDKLTFSNAAYLSIGRGGGTSFGSRPGASYYTEDGLINWQKLYDANYSKDNQFPKIDDDGNFISTFTLRASENHHNWYGLLSKFDYDYDEHWNLSGGIDLRSYEGRHFRTVYDLVGGDVYHEEGKTVPLREGDRYDYDNSTFVNWAGVFSQVEYKKGLVSAFLNISTSSISFRRENYLSGTTEKSGSLSKWGGTIKTGANFNLTEHSNIFVNTGYLNKVRPANFIFNGNAMSFRTDTKNEEVKAFEIGYHYGSEKISLNANGYYTVWNGKPVRNIPNPAENENELILPGLDARHMGVELDGIYKFSDKLDLQATVSLGDWIWATNRATVYEELTENEDVLSLDEPVYISFNNIYVGDAPQSQFGLSLNFKPNKASYIRLKYRYNAKYYSDFNPEPKLEGSIDADPVQPWKVPNFSLFDLSAGYNFDYKKHKINLSVNVFNLFDTYYISDATNNAEYQIDADLDPSFNNTASAASVFFGSNRYFSTALNITL
ncbi:MAG: TonB-dependent receptor [Flavobacteriales bacterium]